MSTRAKQLVAVGGGVLVLAVGAFFLLGGGAEDIPLVNRIAKPRACPLTGEKPPAERILDEPAVAIKVENAEVAYPLSGIEKADIVYEEVVEGGITRFMAIYHCGDAAKVGPVRSSRLIDAAVMTPITRILAAAGGNEIVRNHLVKANVVIIDEPDAGEAMERVARPGLTSEHTLYGDVSELRKIGKKKYDDAPPDGLFAFGDLEGKSKKANSIDIQFSAAASAQYEWRNGKWLRFHGGEPFTAESGKQYAVDNVLIEEHVVNLSKTIVDTAGNPSTEIADETGKGRAVLFRDGRAVVGTWEREAVEDPVVFKTRAGDEMVLTPGTTWIHLVPSDKGDVKGSFSYE